MGNEDITPIFTEKVHHPSEDNTWITMRDYIPIAERSKIVTTPTYDTTTAVDTFNLIAQSYNYQQVGTSNNWTNTQNKIDKNSIDLSAIGYDQKSYLIDDNLQFAAATVSEGDITITNYWNTVTTSGSYTLNGESTTIIDNNNVDWADNFITSAFNTSTTTISLEPNKHIKTNDYIAVPRTSTNGINLELYTINTSVENNINGIDKVPFNHSTIFTDQTTELQKNQEKNLLNLLKISDNSSNYINLIDILNDAYTTITSFTLFRITEDNESTIDLVKINNDNITNKPTYIYGNGAILRKRYNLNASLAEIFTDNQPLSYQYLVLNNGIKNFIVKYDSTNIFSEIYEVSLNVSTDYNGTQQITVNLINDYENDLNSLFINDNDTTVVLSLKWIGSDNWGSNLARYKLFNCYYDRSNTITIHKTYNDNLDDDLIQLHKTNLPNSIIPTSSFVLRDNNNINSDNRLSIDLWTTSNFFQQNLQWIFDDDNDLYTYTSSNYVISLLINSTTNDITISMTDNNYGLEQLWDNIILNELDISVFDIKLYLLFQQITGTVNYNCTLNNVYNLTKKTEIQNINIGADINQLWNHLSFSINSTPTIINSEMIYWQYDFNNHRSIIYYNGGNKTIPDDNKVWFLLPNTLIIKTDDEDDDNFVIFGTNLQTSSYFINQIHDWYSNVMVSITIPDNIEDGIQYHTITYGIYPPAHSIRYYGIDNKLLNVGDMYTPVYLQDGQFVPCKNLKDVLIEVNAQAEKVITGAADIWIDPDD